METDRPSAAADLPPIADQPAQPGRRDFVRSLGREGVRSAGHIAGVVGAVSGLPVSVGAELLGLGSPGAGGGPSPAQAPTSRPTVALVRRPLGPVEPLAGPSPWRFDGIALHVLDQRDLPGAVRELQLDSAAAVAASLDTLATPFGVALGEIASAGMALAARGLVDAAPAERIRALRWNLRLLRGARTSSAAIQVALARQEAALMALAGEVPGAAVATALESEAAAFAAHTVEVSQAIGRAGAERLDRPTGTDGDVTAPVHLLTLGCGGAGSGGGSGTVLAVVAGLLARGRAVRVWVTETRPTLVGARIMAHELVRLGVPVTVLADSAVGALLAQVRVDATLLTAERILPDGDVLAVTGTDPVALMAARHRVPVWVVAPTWLSTQPGPAPTAATAPSRPAAELGMVGGTRLTPGRSDAFVPLLDRTAGQLCAGIISEHAAG